MTIRTCTACGIAKDETDFFRDRSKKHGRQSACKDCKTAKTKAYRKRVGYDKIRYRREKVSERERHLVKKYGVDLSDYSAMLAAQDGGCAICGKTESEIGRALDVDHCHETGEVRGLLCTNCNRFIGHAGDDPDRLEAAAAYLRKSRRSSSKRSHLQWKKEEIDQ